MLSFKIIYDLVRERDSSPEQHLPYHVKNAINRGHENTCRGETPLSLAGIRTRTCGYNGTFFSQVMNVSHGKPLNELVGNRGHTSCFTFVFNPSIVL